MAALHFAHPTAVLRAPWVLQTDSRALEAKERRAAVFAHWLIETYGRDHLRQGRGVLDIAGGRGELSSALAASGIPCTVVDPIQRKPRAGARPPAAAAPSSRFRWRLAGGSLP